MLRTKFKESLVYIDALKNDNISKDKYIRSINADSQTSQNINRNKIMQNN